MKAPNTDGSPGIDRGFFIPVPGDVLRTTASVEQVLAAKASGALAKVKLY